jgi:hypothetical protein
LLIDYYRNVSWFENVWEKKIREMVKDVFLSSSATSSLNEDKESSEDNNLIAPLIPKSATFASTFLANDKCVHFLEAVRI